MNTSCDGKTRKAATATGRVDEGRRRWSTEDIKLKGKGIKESFFFEEINEPSIEVHFSLSSFVASIA